MNPIVSAHDRQRIMAVCLAIMTAVLPVVSSTAEASYWKDRRPVRRGASGASPVDDLRRGLPIVGRVAPRAGDWIDRWRGRVPEHFRREQGPLLQALTRDLGTIRSIQFPPSGRADRLVLYLQDAHRNVDAQRNISRTLRALLATGLVDRIGLEGAFGPLPVEGLRSFPDPAALHAAVDQDLSTSDIGGPLHAALTGPVGPYVGVDDEAHYRANIDAYRRARHRREDDRRRIADARRVNRRAKTDRFRGPLRALDEAVERRNDGGPLTPYVDALAVAGEMSTPAVKSFLRALQREKAIDFAAVERERTVLLETLGKSGNAAVLDRLLGWVRSYRDGSVRTVDFYNALSGAAAWTGRSFPALERYVDYVRVADAVDAEALFRELRAAERAAYERLLRTDAERHLAAQGRGLALLAKLVDFSLTPEEWTDYEAERPVGPVETAAYESFYREARTRDGLMARNLMAGPTSARRMVLVTGGFHAEGLTRRLLDDGAAVVSFVPKISRADGPSGAEALAVFAREKTPLEKLFAGDRRLNLVEPVLTPALEARCVLRASARATRSSTPWAWRFKSIDGRTLDVVAEGADGNGVTTRLVWNGQDLVRYHFSLDGRDSMETRPTPFATVPVMEGKTHRADMSRLIRLGKLIRPVERWFVVVRDGAAAFLRPERTPELVGVVVAGLAMLLRPEWGVSLGGLSLALVGVIGSVGTGLHWERGLAVHHPLFGVGRVVGGDSSREEVRVQFFGIKDPDDVSTEAGSSEDVRVFIGAMRGVLTPLAEPDVAERHQRFREEWESARRDFQDHGAYLVLSELQSLAKSGYFDALRRYSLPEPRARAVFDAMKKDALRRKDQHEKTLEGLSYFERLIIADAFRLPTDKRAVKQKVTRGQFKKFVADYMDPATGRLRPDRFTHYQAKVKERLTRRGRSLTGSFLWEEVVENIAYGAVVDSGRSLERLAESLGLSQRMDDESYDRLRREQTRREDEDRRARREAARRERRGGHSPSGIRVSLALRRLWREGFTPLLHDRILSAFPNLKAEVRRIGLPYAELSQRAGLPDHLTRVAYVWNKDVPWSAVEMELARVRSSESPWETLRSMDPPSVPLQSLVIAHGGQIGRAHV
jgi:hypothetical protein